MDNTQTRTPADMMIQAHIGLDDDGLILADIDNYRSDAPPSELEWGRFLARTMPDRSMRGTFDLTIYVVPRYENTGELPSFRESLTLAHCGTVTISDFGVSVTLRSREPRYGDLSGLTFPLAPGAADTWSYDLHDLIEAHRGSKSSQTLVENFLSSHVVGLN